MNCPNCNTKTTPVIKYSIEIDVCPSCKGVWLDKGELCKIIEASKREDDLDDYLPKERSKSYSQPDRDYSRDYNRDYNKKHRRKESFFERLFEGFGGDD